MPEGSESTSHHHQLAQSEGIIPIAIVTVSDTRTPEDDKNGSYLRQQIEALGHRLTDYRIVRDEVSEVGDVLEELVASDARIVIFNGGTGISPRDRTFDVLDRKLEKHLPGFGELFRMLSYDQVGAAAMLSRATAGVYSGTVIFSTPGSHAAVQLAWEKLIAPEIQHLAWEVIR